METRLASHVLHYQVFNLKFDVLDLYSSHKQHEKSTLVESFGHTAIQVSSQDSSVTGVILVAHSLSFYAIALLCKERMNLQNPTYLLSSSSKCFIYLFFSSDTKEECEERPTPLQTDGDLQLRGGFTHGRFIMC